jgi:hypothetical protein
VRIQSASHPFAAATRKVTPYTPVTSANCTRMGKRACEYPIRYRSKCATVKVARSHSSAVHARATARGSGSRSVPWRRARTGANGSHHGRQTSPITIGAYQPNFHACGYWRIQAAKAPAKYQDQGTRSPRSAV